MRLYYNWRHIAASTKKYANLPDSYLERTFQKVSRLQFFCGKLEPTMQIEVILIHSYSQVYWKNPKGPNFRPNVAHRQGIWRFTTNRPWTDEHQRSNERVPSRVVVEPLKTWDYFRGDRVSPDFISQI